MSRIVSFMRDLVAKGMAWEDAALFAERMEDSIDVAVSEAVAMVRPTLDPAREKKRDRDRERMRQQREGDIAATSPATVASDTLSQGSQGSLSPTPPISPNPPNPIQVPPIVPQISAKSKPPKGAFARFWAEYPLKVGKLACERVFLAAWAKALEENPEADPEEEILGGLRRCKPLWEPEFIPHPKTWLNRGGWLDQLIPDTPDAGKTVFDLSRHEADKARIRAQIEAEEAAA